jgi:hypothetical protein
LGRFLPWCQILLLFTAGCAGLDREETWILYADHRVLGTRARFTTLEERERWGQSVEHSPTFRRVLSVDPLRAMWAVDGTNGHHTVILVGYDMGTHVHRAHTLRIGINGVVERMEGDPDAEQSWVLDK